LLVIALITSPSLARMSQLALASLSVRLGFLFLAIAVPGLVVSIVKRIVGRARPVVAGEDAFLYKFFLWRVEYASFPSGHATTAFAAAVAFGVLWPKLRPLLWTYAIVIALSRVIVTAHHPSDVVAGAIAGVIGALLVRDWMAARRLGFSVLSDGTVKPFEGPSWARIKWVARDRAGQ
jgi:undecaprenyl-diphosphatase